ncbi:hypothetical protein CL633_03325 [bacterium]|nr:hypothetical protein [bacterium]|tara:strand:- start:1834 stop:2013 length:180 start_codon:yes stop_codon:yes gene_type:complete
MSNPRDLRIKELEFGLSCRFVDQYNYSRASRAYLSDFIRNLERLIGKKEKNLKNNIQHP